MSDRSILWLPLLLLHAAPLVAQRVVLVSLDGLGAATLFKDPVAAELVTIQRAIARGVSAETIPTFPSLTAASHCAIWTGAAGDVNLIATNDNPVLPRAEHLFTERRSGYRSEQLAAEPIWVTAARQGIPTVAHQATQAFPFSPRNTASGAVVVNGYQTENHAPARLLRLADLPRDSNTGELTWTSGSVSFVGRQTRSGLRIRWSAGTQWVDVKSAPPETDAPRKRPLARRFSQGLWVTQPVRALVYFRLFDAPEGPLLYQSPVQELALHDGQSRNDEDVRALLRHAGGWVGNGLELEGEQGLEILELVARQMARHAAWLAHRYNPRLMQSYLPFPDEFDHDWIARAKDGDADVQRWRRWGYVIVNRFCEEIAAIAGRKGHIVFVSDHGMAIIRKRVNVNQVLSRAGLGTVASHAANYVLLNTTDWKNGTVPAGDRENALLRIETSLREFRDPQTGQLVFARFWRPGQTDAPPGIGGPAGGDLYFDLAPGYGTESGRSPILAPSIPPRGAHGFLPARDDMRAILVAQGPNLPQATRWPNQRTVNIAPLIAVLLGIDAPANSVGRSPLYWGYHP